MPKTLETIPPKTTKESIVNFIAIYDAQDLIANFGLEKAIEICFKVVKYSKKYKVPIKPDYLTLLDSIDLVLSSACARYPGVLF